jgi:hypothetical protein
MKVTIVRGGGIGGMTTRTTLESGTLPAAEAQALTSRVRGAALHEERPPESSPRTPDDLLYEIAVDDAGHQVAQRFTDAAMPDEVRRLVEWVDARPERADSIE